VELAESSPDAGSLVAGSPSASLPRALARRRHPRRSSALGHTRGASLCVPYSKQCVSVFLKGALALQSSCVARHACVFVDLFIFFTYRGCGFEFEMVRCCNVDDEYTYALRVVQMAAV
jgi:hypothetical protein